ncbi:CobQ/CobB/MinD/ParA nucleotide binding domain protein [Nonomuraea coxensis DSM 45129]|uniref:CobQ/CobB/MinD/ParA nucleotide binding domain protein n=1 Tax=Nonomuraea coxensis DSM 45129 TaxID=1122611 RepID=A0ABX8TT93_9ACTN|nr:MinD/ParA family protein [Nonomuraea coxensis]QYC37784.1 CobQ/CobB/MinD/ParA nucleotide binding domain protein [Nonomuraea coxensis DSM 45129]
MARHDREESLEEQLAWLDAIKESDETPVPVGASAAAADEPVSPYPKDPWSLVPAQPDTPAPTLFRAAADSVAAAEPAVPAVPADAEAGWLGDAATTDITREALREINREQPPAPAVDDPFHAPLKPLPRSDDTETYGLTFTPSAADGPEGGPAERREDETWPPADWSRPSEPGGWRRGTFEEPAQVEEPAPEERPEPWAATQPRNELPKWDESDAAPSRPEPRPESSTESPDGGTPPPSPGDRSTGPVTGLTRDEPAPHAEAPEEAAEHRAERPRTPAAHDPEPPRAESSWPEPLRPEPSRPEPSLPEPFRSEPSSEPARNEPTAAQPDAAQPAASERATSGPATTEPGPTTSERAGIEAARSGPARRQDRPQWTERQEWRPAERDIPPVVRRRPAPVPVFTSPPRPPVTGRPTADSLDPETLLRGRRNAPSKGWRRLVYKASGGWIKPGEPPEVRRRRELMNRARTPVTTGHHRVAVLSLKGGVGKTTTTVGLGATLAQVRGDRVIAVDANPDRGTLSDKLVLETSATVRDLLNERDQVKRYVDIRAFTSQAPSRLEVLASDRDPSVSEAFSGADYQAVSQVLENFYSICITDCGTGLLHSAMGGVLGLADQIVLVSSPSVDGARAASATLDWLEAHHYGDLVKNATVVLCSVRPRSKSAVDIQKLEAHFAARCRAVVQVPYDPHLEEGAEIDLDRLQDSTREAYLKLAAHVGDGFATLRE